jgi:hypothetical protein
MTAHGSMPFGIEEMAMRWILTDYKRFQLPVYCSNLQPDGTEKAAGLMPRQCTVDFKIVPVKQLVRQIVLKQYNLGPRQRFPKDVGVIMHIGFALDEIKRIERYQSPQFDYMYLCYPLVELNETTEMNIDYLKARNMPLKRSRCYLCPFNCDMRGMDWAEIIEEEPFSFLKACWIDEHFRIVQAQGNKPMRSIPYLHFKRIPLKEAFPQEYKQILLQYQNKLDAWLLDWNTYIYTKYSNQSSLNFDLIDF